MTALALPALVIAYLVWACTRGVFGATRVRGNAASSLICGPQYATALFALQGSSPSLGQPSLKLSGVLSRPERKLDETE